MNIEVQISFSENSIVLQSGDTTKYFVNLIGIDNTTNKIASIGQTEQELSAFNPQVWEKIKHKIVFVPIFESQKFDPEKMSWATEYLLGRFHQDSRGMKLFDKIVCHVAIPNYEAADIKAREHFEFSLEPLDNIKTLTINGATIFSKGWQYCLAKNSLEWNWIILLVAFLIGSNSLIPTLLNLFNLDSAPIKLVTILPAIFLMFCAIFIFLWSTEIIWMFAMQSLFPKRTLRRIFDRYQRNRTRPKEFSLSKVFADLILGKNP